MIRDLLLTQKTPDKTAVFEQNQEISYARLLQKARRLEKLLPQEQQKIAILLPNCGDYISAFFAVIMSGKTVMPIHTLMTPHEIFPLLRQANVHTVITTSAFQSVMDQIFNMSAYSLNPVFLDRLSTAENGFDTEIASNTVSSSQIINYESSDKPMVLFNTSGTTGIPKIVQLSEKNVETAVFGYLNKLAFDEVDRNQVRYILCVPFSSAYGVMILLACLIMSFPMIVLDHSFSLDALFSAAEQYKATHYEGSTSTILLMEQVAGRPIPYGDTLKYFGFGGSKISGNSIEAVQKAYKGRMFYQGYGMTEASPLISKHPQTKSIKAESVGTAIEGVEIAIDDGNGISLTPFIKGEVVIRGSNMMLGYLDNQAETNKVIKNGYLYTGDIGYLDEESYLFICGRKKNIIIVRGFNVYPEEVETCIQNSLLALDCVVYGQSDSPGNETVCADIVPAHQEINKKDIIQFCSRHLAEYKIPCKISFVSSIDRNAAGKINRQ